MIKRTHALAMTLFLILGMGAVEVNAQGRSGENSGENSSDNSGMRQTWVDDATFGIYNPCCDEFITFTGTYYFFVNRNSQTQTFKFHSNLQGGPLYAEIKDPTTGEVIGTRTYHGNNVSNTSDTYERDGTTLTLTRSEKRTFSSTDGCSFTLISRVIRTIDLSTNTGTTEVVVDKVICKDDETDLG